MQHNTMASSSQCPPAVLLTTEAKAELNAGLIIVTGHIPTCTADVDMDQATPDVCMPPTAAPGSSSSDAPAPKARRIAHSANRRSADEWVTALYNSRASFLATTAVPEDPAEAIRGGLVLTPLLGCKARTPLDWTHAWAMLGEWAGTIAFPIPEQGDFFCGRRHLPFGGSHLRLPSGPAGIRTTTGSLSALARPTPYQLSHRVASRSKENGRVMEMVATYDRTLSSEPRPSSSGRAPYSSKVHSPPCLSSQPTSPYSASQETNCFKARS